MSKDIILMKHNIRALAEKLLAKLMLRFELKHGTIGIQISIIEKVLTELVNKAWREARHEERELLARIKKRVK